MAESFSPSAPRLPARLRKRTLRDLGDEDPFSLPPAPIPKDPLHKEFPTSLGVISCRDEVMRSRQRDVIRFLPALVERFFGFRLYPPHLELLRRLFRVSVEDAVEYWSPKKNRYWSKNLGYPGQPFRWDRYWPDAHLEPEPAIHQVILMFTGGGKSFYGTIVFPILSLMEDPNGAHIICCNNLDEATMRVGAVRAILSGEDPKFHELLKEYPWIGQRAREKWATRKFTVVGREERQNINPSMVALGKGDHSVKGRRGRFIADDLEGNEALASNARDKLRAWATTEAIRTIENTGFGMQRPLQAFLGTPYDLDSIFFFLANSGYDLLRVPARYPGTPEHPKGQLTFPEAAPRIKEMRRVLDDRAYAIAMRLDPTGGDPSVLTFNQIQQLAEGEEQEEQQHDFGFVFLDPAAGSKNKRVDYAGVGVCEIDWAEEDEYPKVLVREPQVFTEGVLEQVHWCTHLHHRSGYPVIFETNGWQATTYRALFQQHHPEVPLIGFYTSPKRKMDRHMGLSVVRTLLRAHRLKVIGKTMTTSDEDLEDEVFERKQIDLDVRQFLTEIRNLDDPSAHNHISAGVWFCIRNAYENRRKAGFNLISTSAGGGNYRPRSFASTRVLDISGYRR